MRIVQGLLQSQNSACTGLESQQAGDNVALSGFAENGAQEVHRRNGDGLRLFGSREDRERVEIDQRGQLRQQPRIGSDIRADKSRFQQSYQFQGRQSACNCALERRRIGRCSFHC